MVLSILDYTIIKVVQATHHQIDVTYGTTKELLGLCLDLII